MVPSSQRLESIIIYIFFCIIAIYDQNPPQWGIYYHCLWIQLSTTCSIATEVAQWVALSCCQPQLGRGDGVRDG